MFHALFAHACPKLLHAASHLAPKYCDGTLRTKYGAQVAPVLPALRVHATCVCTYRTGAALLAVPCSKRGTCRTGQVLVPSPCTEYRSARTLTRSSRCAVLCLYGDSLAFALEIACPVKTTSPPVLSLFFRPPPTSYPTSLPPLSLSSLSTHSLIHSTAASADHSA